jgi:hypothetical protein
MIPRTNKFEWPSLSRGDWQGNAQDSQEEKEECNAAAIG